MHADPAVIVSQIMHNAFENIIDNKIWCFTLYGLPKISALSWARFKWCASVFLTNTVCVLFFTPLKLWCKPCIIEITTKTFTCQCLGRWITNCGWPWICLGCCGKDVFLLRMSYIWVILMRTIGTYKNFTYSQET